MPDLFASTPSETGPLSDVPLAERMRPSSLEEYVGQEHLLAKGRLLRRAIEADRLGSAIFYGPPGTGKTSLAELVARVTRARFERLSGVESSVADLRKTIQIAANRLSNTGEKTVLFIDEIHRWNRAQQDVLLPDVERGTVRLIGATTQNPFHSINAPLVSRSQIFQLEPLSPNHLLILLQRALQDPVRGLGKQTVRASHEALLHLATLSDGDARKALNSLEIAVLTTPASPDGAIDICLTAAEESIQRKAVVYGDDGHYDTISAFIKSIRGGDPDAALYWLAKMLHAGEDIRFIARRLVISASEDIGMADSQGLLVAIAASQACEWVGLPEAQITLAHATVYLATAPKSNRAYAAFLQAKEEVQNGVTLPVPRHLRDKHYAGAERLGHEGYLYSHDYEGGYVPQAYLPEGRRYYSPSDQGMEKRVRERLAYWRSLFDSAHPTKDPKP